MTYAPEHEKELLDRSIRRRMAVSRVPCRGSQQAWTAADPRQPHNPRRHLLCLEERLPLASAALRLPALGDRLLVVYKMANRQDLGAAQYSAARALAATAKEEPAAQRGGRGLPVSQDHRSWWRSARL